jgi:hypothetical protein
VGNRDGASRADPSQMWLVVHVAPHSFSKQVANESQGTMESLNFKQSSRPAHWHRRHGRHISLQTRLRFNVLLLRTQINRTHRPGLKNHEHR